MKRPFLSGCPARKREANKKLAATGPAVFAYDDPPWTPPFLQRNGILIPVARERVGNSSGSHTDIQEY